MKSYLTLLLLCMGLRTLGQSTFYVSPNGDDNAAGTNINTPWKTVQKACSAATVGSTVYFRGGVYPTNYAVVTVSGSVGNYITFKNYAQEIPVIDGGNTAQTLFRITDKAYLIVEGLHFTKVAGNGSRGVAVEGTSHHIQIKNSRISEINVSTAPGYLPMSCSENVSPLKFCGSNAAQAMTDIVISGNEVFSCKTGCSEGVCVSGNVDNFVIEKNHVHDIANIGIVAAGFYDSCAGGQARNGRIAENVVYNCRFANPAINTTASGIYLDGAKNVIVEHNRVYACQVGIHAGCEHNGAGQTADGNTLRNNIVYNNEKWGIGMGGIVGYAENTRIVNNTLFYNNYFYNGSFYGDFGEICLQQVRNSSVNNNSCFVRFQAGNAVFMKWEFPNALSNININHNNYYAPDACSGSLLLVRNGPGALSFSGYQALGYDANGTTLNPQFVHPFLPHPDVHLMATSPHLNTGDNTLAAVAGSFDFDGNARQTGTLDKGAYEYQVCPPVYKLFADSPVGSVDYQASQVIHSNGKVAPGTHMGYTAGQSILLKPDFRAESGSVLTAKIAGCPVANWTTVFSDDFNACGNLSQWTLANRDDYNSNNVPNIQCTYVPSVPVINALDNKSCLLITATKKAGNSYQYESGHCKSNFSFTPGLNEEYHLSASIKLLAKSGTTFKGFAQTYGAWPAFWTVKEDGLWPTKGETDIMEAYSRGTDMTPNANYACDIHYGTTAGTNQVNAKVSYDAIGEGWHTYEQYWKNQNGTVSVTIRVDGNTRAVYTNASHPNLQLQNFGAHSIIFNLNVGANPGLGIFNNAQINLFSQTMMYVDYVRLRKRSL